MFQVRPSGVWISIAGMWNPLLARVLARSSVVFVVAFMFVVSVACGGCVVPARVGHTLAG